MSSLPDLPRPMLWREVGGIPMQVDDTLAWAEHFEAEDRRVGFDALCSHEYVSTVFLGIDHNFMLDGPRSCTRRWSSAGCATASNTATPTVKQLGPGTTRSRRS